MSVLNVIYIRETKDTCDIIKRIILRIKCFFNIIDVEKVEQRTIYNLPIFFNENTSKYKLNKLSKKIIKKLEDNGVKNIVLSKYLYKLQSLKNNLYSENINILEGRYLFKCLTYEVIEHILKRQNKNIYLSDVSILLNDFNNINKELIIDIAKHVKTINVITNHIDKCKEIENYLCNEFGILINISNNKKISLSNSQIILNFDFSEEGLNQYVISDKAVIINFEEKILIKSKKFSGININYFKISIPKEYKIDGFRNEEVYESIIYKRDFYTMKKTIAEDKIRIKRLIGNNGYIMDREYIDKL